MEFKKVQKMNPGNTTQIIFQELNRHFNNIKDSKGKHFLHILSLELNKTMMG